MAFFGRGLNRIQNPYNLSDMYGGYIDWIAEKELYTVNQRDFVKVIGDFNKGVVEELLKGETFNMPSGMGSFRIIKSERNSPITTSGAIDWETTNKVGQVVHFRNQHSDGYRYKLHWGKGNKRIKNVKFYYFIPCRAFKRSLAKIIKARETDYFQLT